MKYCNFNGCYKLPDVTIFLHDRRNIKFMDSSDYTYGKESATLLPACEKRILGND